jgi:NADPH2:quinone reductase
LTGSAACLDGTLVGFGGLTPPYGTLAQYAAVPAAYTAPIAEGIEPPIAAVLSSAISAMSMRTAAGLSAGETVLVQGGTGVAGRLPIQVARLPSAGRIVATGRTDDALRELAALGADATINTGLGDAGLGQAFRDHAGDGYDVVADYLWGRLPSCSPAR